MPPPDPNSSQENLERLLNLLCLCHKYESSVFENNLLATILPITRDAGALTGHLSLTLTPYQVLETACILGHEEVGRGARCIILEEIWGSSFVPTIEKLRFGERIGDNEIVGAIYYRIMCPAYGTEGTVASVLSELDAHQNENLERGKRKCADKWHAIFDEWGVNAELAGDNSQWLHMTWTALARGHFTPYDIVGRVKAALTVAEQGYCQSLNFDTELCTQLQNLKSSAHEFFLVPRPDVGVLQ